MPDRAFISIGSNIEPGKHIVLGLQRLAELGRVLAVSKVYENPAVGPSGQPDFLNAAMLIETNLPLDEVREKLTEIEDELGRTRSDDNYDARTIDLDLCLYGDFVSRSDVVALPHPDILERAYLAVTLSELDPEYRHPVTDERLADLAERLRPGAKLLERADVRPKPSQEI
ncbi:MAG: 2-amino-4-hydroxy-6-hydroxymethyldihydropteridine diphosphokinase [Planctomycetes bacterium]|nr:2-amino-4-hydroxy-6-hydroxymethyldihydropteridine diphosphokinase [Planctomycetota bacterium]